MMNDSADRGPRRAFGVALCALCLLGAAGSPPAAALPPPDVKPVPAVAPNLSVEEILRRNARARGGPAAWRRITSMVQIGFIEHENDVPDRAARDARAQRIDPDAAQIVEFRLELQRPNKMRMELKYRGATAIQAFDGTVGYTVQPGPGGAIARPYADAQNRAAASQQGLDGPLLGAAANGTVATFAGIEDLGGRPAYKLNLALKNGATRHVWVDAQSFLDVKIDGTREIGGRIWPIETMFSGFRKVGEVEVPYEIRTAVDGVHTMERMRVLKVLLNVPLEASLFTLPRAPAAAAGSSAPPRRGVPGP